MGSRLAIKTMYSTVGHKSHDPCFDVFLIVAWGMAFVANCTMRHVLQYANFPTKFETMKGDLKSENNP